MQRPSEPSGVLFIVDDDEFVRDSTAVFLKAGGRTVRTFASARECLAALDFATPAGIVCDLHMPEMNGAELVEAVRGRGVTCPLVVFTGDPESALVERALACGADGVLAKPLSGRRIEAEFERIAAAAN
jgi:two-component system response regulator FixJ